MSLAKKLWYLAGLLYIYTKQIAVICRRTIVAIKQQLPDERGRLVAYYMKQIYFI